MRLTKLVNFLLFCMAIAACDSDSTSDSSLTGQGGSMTRFAINNNYLYVVDQQRINVFSIEENTFQKAGEISVGFGLETIFATSEYLYLGANDAMYIYSLAKPNAPEFIFRYSHIQSCDPVVVQGNRAYVTLRGGNACNQGSNALEIIDITNPYSPTLIHNYPMQSPYGLAVDNTLLFLCEGENGLKVFDISNENQIELTQHLKTFFAYDVIARNGLLIITGEDGIFQYQYDFPSSVLKFLGKIPVSRSDV